MMTATTSNLNPIDFVPAAKLIARDKGLDPEEVLGIMEMAIQKAARSKYGHEHDIRVHIDRETSAIDVRRVREIVEDMQDNFTQILLEDAKKIRKDAAVGELIEEQLHLDPIDLGRVAAQVAKQEIVRGVRDAERRHQFEEFKDRVGEIINGVVKRIEFGNVIIEINQAEALLRRDEMIPREMFQRGDRIRALVLDLKSDTKGPQIILSRTHPQFMAKLFAQEVPEVYDGVIEIRSVARDPGSRAKIAVISRDSTLDPVGACVGMRGSRVQAVVNELQGEKIDIIPWTDDVAALAVSALAPAQVGKVILDEVARRMEVVVPDEQLSLAIGRRGQNVRLAAQLIGWEIDVLTEQEESERRAEEFKQRSEMFIHALDVEDVIAHLLVAEGFVSPEDVAYTSIEELAGIEGFDENVAEALKARAEEYLAKRQEEINGELQKLGVQDDLRDMEGLDQEMILTLAKEGILSKDDFADLASDELIEFLGSEKMTLDQANDMIMAARAHWFADEENAEEAN